MRTSVFMAKNKHKRNKALISFIQFTSNTWFSYYCPVGITCL